MTKTKITFCLLALLLGFSVLPGKINVYLRTERSYKTIETTVLDNRDYVCIDEINAIFNSVLKQEYTDHRVHLHLYSEQFIFLLDSSYYSFKNQVFNMHYPVLRKGDKVYLPGTFVLEHLPLHFSQEVEYKAGYLYVTRPRDRSVKRIVLDPGHGGKDPGAVGKKGTREKDINLAVCLKLKQLLERELGVTVLMTRSDDRFVSLGDRTRFANENKADLFVSVHTNASTKRSIKGMETYYLSAAVSSDARAVEALENDVVELYEGKGEKQKYDDLAFILSDLSQTEHLENSNNLAFFVQQNLVAGSKSEDRGVKQANFYVLRGAFMPSILIEMGFISNADEEALLANPKYQDRLARTIFEGIKRFKYRYDRIRNT